MRAPAGGGARSVVKHVTALAWLAMSLMLLGRPGLAEDVLCSKAEIAKKAEDVQLARKALLALPIKDLDTNVTPDARRAITRMKAILGDFLNAYMRCAPMDVTPETVQRDLSELGHAFTLEQRVYSKDEITPDWDHYGFQLSFNAKAFAGAGLLGVVADFQIYCGSDAVLFVLSRDLGGWKEVLRWQAKDYKTVAGGFGAFDYEIAPPDRQGRWLVAVKHVVPWCNGSHSIIRYSVLRPRPHTVIPDELVSGADDMWWGDGEGGEDWGRLSVRETGFELQFHDFDGGDSVTFVTKNFQIAGGRVRRVKVTIRRIPIGSAGR
jgi:hypothetical protein